MKTERVRISAVDRLFGSLRDRGWEPGAVAGWDEELTRKNYAAIARANLYGTSEALSCVSVELLAANQPDTVRGNMYSVVSAGWLPDTSAKTYGKIQRLLNTLRKKGIIPYEWIVDNVRSTIKPSSWSGLEDFADTVAGAYRKNFWAGLPDFVEIIVEKDTVAGRVEPVTREYDVSLHPLRGYSSTSFAWAIARRWLHIEKPIVVYYIGDHDPSGRDIERSIIQSLKEHGKRDFKWQRLAVEPRHFEQFNMIPLAVKKNDSRAIRFIERFGEKCAEVEAVPAADLRQMVRGAIESHIPADRWAHLKKIEQQEKAAWTGFVQKLKKETVAISDDAISDDEDPLF